MTDFHSQAIENIAAKHDLDIIEIVGHANLFSDEVAQEERRLEMLDDADGMLERLKKTVDQLHRNFYPTPIAITLSPDGYAQFQAKSAQLYTVYAQTPIAALAYGVRVIEVRSQKEPVREWYEENSLRLYLAQDELQGQGQIGDVCEIRPHDEEGINQMRQWFRENINNSSSTVSGWGFPNVRDIEEKKQ